MAHDHLCQSRCKYSESKVCKHLWGTRVAGGKAAIGVEAVLEIQWWLNTGGSLLFICLAHSKNLAAKLLFLALSIDITF